MHRITRNIPIQLVLVALFGTITAPSMAHARNDITFESEKLLSPDGLRDDHFGEVISADTGLIAVGVDDDDIVGTRSGSVKLFNLTSNNYLGRIYPDDARSDDRFGISLDLQNGIFVSGAWGDDDLGAFSGSAYVFDAITGTQIVRLKANDGASFDQFGHSVGIDHGLIAVGSVSDDDLGSMSGSVYLFDQNTGEQLLKLTPKDGGSQHNFGLRLILRNNFLIVSAPGDDENGPDSGSVYVFDRPNFELRFKFTPNDGKANDQFGYYIDTNNGMLAVGTTRDTDAKVYLYDLQNGELSHILIANDGFNGDRFGSSVAVTDQLVLVGAENAHGIQQFSGAAYAFDRDTGNQIRKLVASDGKAEDGFGHSIDFSDGTILIGSPGNDETDVNAGSIYLFDANCEADFNGDFMLDYIDVSIFFAFYSFADIRADMTGDGILNYYDVSAFLLAFWNGCLN